MIAALALCLALAPPPIRAASPAASLSVRGQVRSAGERTPLAGARVFAASRPGVRPAWTREATTTAAGEFVLTDLPSRDFILTLVAPGHERLDAPTTPAYWRGRRPPVIYLQPSGAGRYRTIVAASREERPSPVSPGLSADEIASLPGSQGDPLRALQNLPGIARVPGGLGLLVLRGATPTQSQVFFGEHPLPRAFHVPGLASVVPGAALAGVEYTPGNFAAAYGNAVGGIVTLIPRVGRRDGIHGHARLDVISAGAALEGPLGRGSFLFAASRGYLDLALEALRPVLGAPFVLPRTYDYQLALDHPLGPRGRITLRLLGASDHVSYPTESLAPFRFTLVSAFHRVDLTYRWRSGAWSALIAPAIRLDRGGGFTDTFLRRRSDVVGLFRAELSQRASRRFTWTLGTDLQLDRFSALVFQEETDWIDGRELRGRGLTTTSGLYLTSALSLGPVSIWPGARVSLFTSDNGFSADQNSAAYAVDPRLLVRWTPHERVWLSLGAGLYSQASLLRQRINAISPLIDPGDNLLQSGSVLVPLGDGAVVLPGAVRYLDGRLDLEVVSPVAAARAQHLSASLHVDFGDHWSLDLTGFFRRVHDHTPPREGISPFGPTLISSGSLAHGVEALLRRDLTRRLRGWLAYTWMRADQGLIRETYELSVRRPAEFDQRHNFLALVQLRLPRRWELGARFRIVTGLPYTPIVGATYEDPGVHCQTPCPLLGAESSARMPVFHQLDVRVDKTWVFRRAILGLYFDVQNVYNKQNAEALVYNRYFTRTTAVVGVPILPVLGARLSY